MDRVIDRLIPSQPAAPAAPIPTPSPQPAANASNTISPNILTKLDSLETAIAQQAKTLDTLASTLAQKGQILSQQGQMDSQLSQGFNTLTQLVASMQGGSGSNGSSSLPAAPSSPVASADPASRPAFTADDHDIIYPDSRLCLNYSTGKFYHYTEPTGYSNQMVDDIQTAKKVGSRKLHTTALIKEGRPFNKELELGKVVTGEFSLLAKYAGCI